MDNTINVDGRNEGGPEDIECLGHQIAAAVDPSQPPVGCTTIELSLWAKHAPNGA